MDSKTQIKYIKTDFPISEFENKVWKKAKEISVGKYWSGDDAPKGRQFKARLLWSETAIYVRFEANKGEPLIVSEKPNLTSKTRGLWDRDVCEIFIAPHPQEVNRYFEFEAAPTGEWIDLAIHLTPAKRETDWEFHSGMTAAASVTADRVTIAMHIPWDDWIHKPQKGEKWRVNLFRCVGTGDERYMAWQPTRTAEPNFHVSEVFGWLEFS